LTNSGGVGLCSQRLQQLTDELEAVRASKHLLERNQEKLMESLQSLSHNYNLVRFRCNSAFSWTLSMVVMVKPQQQARSEKAETALEALRGQLEGQRKTIEGERYEWKLALDAKSQKEADLKEELKTERYALGMAKQRLEEYDAKQRMWSQIHEQLATANESIARLEAELAATKAALVEAENKPPTIVTQTVEVIKVRMIGFPLHEIDFWL
jgi:predicted  nucleic acid-binding Zn-ribbon protein